MAHCLLYFVTCSLLSACCFQISNHCSLIFDFFSLPLARSSLLSSPCLLLSACCFLLPACCSLIFPLYSSFSTRNILSLLISCYVSLIDHSRISELFLLFNIINTCFIRVIFFEYKGTFPG